MPSQGGSPSPSLVRLAAGSVAVARSHSLARANRSCTWFDRAWSCGLGVDRRAWGLCPSPIARTPLLRLFLLEVHQAAAGPTLNPASLLADPHDMPNLGLLAARLW
jgi:hypothetical protein